MSVPNNFPTLQSIVRHEVQAEVAQVRNSATEALLWLRRGLKFLKEFLSEVNKGEQDIQGALSEQSWTYSNAWHAVLSHRHVSSRSISLYKDNAYGKTLRQYHGWVVRGVFAVGIPHFLHCLLVFDVCHCLLLTTRFKCTVFSPLSWPWELPHLIKISPLP